MSAARHAYEQNRARVADIWAQAQPVKSGDPADLYLRRQRLHLRQVPDALRLHPSLELWEVTAKGHALCRGRFPALVAALEKEVFPRGPRHPSEMHTVALQRIYLGVQGTGNLQAPSFIKTTGTTGDGRGAAVRLAAPDLVNGELTLGVAVGVTAALRFSQALGVPFWAVADRAALVNFHWPRGLNHLYVVADDLAGAPARELVRKAIACGLRATGQRVEAERPAN